MTNQKKQDIFKWAVGVVISLILVLMTIQASFIVMLNNNVIKFMQDNTSQHRLIEKKLNFNYDWTHSVYEYEIKPNTERSKNNEKRLTKGGL